MIIYWRKNPIFDSFFLQGDFDTCEFCNTCRFMNSKGLTDESRSLLLDLKHAHILQQGVCIVLTIVFILLACLSVFWPIWLPFSLVTVSDHTTLFLYSADRERQQADIRRAEAREIDQLTGMYRHAYLLVDPCTNFRGNSPVVGKKADKTDITGKMAKHFEQRIIGVEVVCGPIDGIFFYTTDNMQRGGANVIVSWI